MTLRHTMYTSYMSVYIEDIVDNFVPVNKVVVI